MEKLLMFDHVTEWGSLVWESHIETPWNARVQRWYVSQAIIGDVSGTHLRHFYTNYNVVPSKFNAKLVYNWNFTMVYAVYATCN